MHLCQAVNPHLLKARGSMIETSTQSTVEYKSVRCVSFKKTPDILIVADLVQKYKNMKHIERLIWCPQISMPVKLYNTEAWP